jgi:GntR family transcriptional regulator, transcriptional repressor for pyruvate dehydrogenase complex
MSTRSPAGNPHVPRQKRRRASSAERRDRELELLTMVRDSDEPVGSWALMEIFEKRGIYLSPATYGRLLTQLEKQGYLERKSFKGRIITKKGQKAISQAQDVRRLEIYNERLKDLLNSRLLRHFIMVLEARKAIERETVRKAAERITKKQIQRLEELESMRESNYEHSVNDPRYDIEFHTLIAQASGNEVLVVFSEIVRTLHQQSEIFDSMRMHMARPYFISHRKLIQALKAGDPKAAERCIIQHIETLMADVNEYSKEHPPEKQ